MSFMLDLRGRLWYATFPISRAVTTHWISSLNFIVVQISFHAATIDVILATQLIQERSTSRMHVLLIDVQPR